MSNETIFDDPADPAPASEPREGTKIEDLVGEGKKFRTLDDLVKKIHNADAFIEQLKDEGKNLRDELAKRTNAADNLEELRREIAALKTAPKQPDEPSPNTTGELTAEKLEAVVASVITKQEQSRTARENLAASNQKMAEHFGGVDKAKEVFNQKASELGMSPSELKAIASKSPTAFFQMVGIAGKPAPKGPNMQSSVTNTAAMPANSGQPQKGTREYYNSIRRERGNAAFFADVKLQQEIFQAKLNGTYE